METCGLEKSRSLGRQISYRAVGLKSNEGLSWSITEEWSGLWNLMHDLIFGGGNSQRRNNPCTISWYWMPTGVGGSENGLKSMHNSNQDNNTPETMLLHWMVCVNHSLHVYGGCGADPGRLADLELCSLCLRDKIWHKLQAFFTTLMHCVKSSFWRFKPDH